MSVLAEEKLPTGETLRLLRVMPPEPCPADILRYAMASYGWEHPERAGDVGGEAYWRSDCRLRLTGAYADQCADHFYFAAIDNAFAARMWFGYNRRTGLGNFGHVFTEPAFRGRGLMGRLMRSLIADFTASPADMLCCATGNPIAAASYRKSGFAMIHGGDTDPMTLIHPRHEGGFARQEELRFDGGGAVARCREGTPGDQFDCDKFLAYSSDVYNHQRHSRLLAGAWLADYRIAFQEARRGCGVVRVAENEKGAVVGYAFALRQAGHHWLDFTLHGAYADGGPALLQDTLRAFGAPALTAAADAEKCSILERAGARRLAVVPLHQAATTANLYVLEQP